MKYEILLHTMLMQGDIQAVDSKTKTDSKALDDLRTFYKIDL